MNGPEKRTLDRTSFAAPGNWREDTWVLPYNSFYHQTFEEFVMDLVPAVMIDGFDFAQRRGGVKTEFCPNVAGFCPGVSGNLTWSGRFLSCCALCLKWIDAIYAGCFREQGVKIDGFSGECGALVRFVCWCLFPVSRARARLGTGYGEAGVDQGEFIQLLVGEVQYFERQGARQLFLIRM